MSEMRDAFDYVCQQSKKMMFMILMKTFDKTILYWNDFDEDIERVVQGRIIVHYNILSFG
jgi:hypothetical protein